MQCFICVTYLIILCSGNPTTREIITTKHEKRSLFHDVLQSLRIHTQPYNVNQNDNKLTYVGFDMKTEQHMPGDSEFLPRRNDRIEMPTLKYRYPKSVENNTNIRGVIDTPKEEVIVYIDTNNKTPKTTTQKPKKDKRPRPTEKYKYDNKNKDNEDANDDADASGTSGYVTMSNTMAGQSQIGNRESQTVIKPTVIVNLRGTISHRDSDIRLQRKDNRTKIDIPRNIFNINQEINLEKGSDKLEPSKLRQGVKVVVDETRMKMQKNLMLCESPSLEDVNNNDDKENPKFDNVLQILFTI